MRETYGENHVAAARSLAFEGILRASERRLRVWRPSRARSPREREDGRKERRKRI